MIPIIQKTRAEIVVYPRHTDPILVRPKGESEESTESNSLGMRLLSVETQKSLGAHGTWTAEVKVPRSRRRDFEQAIVDGDWVDVVMQRGRRRHHVMRGLLDSIDPIESLGSSSSAATLMYRLSGQDHGVIFDSTQLWFSVFSEENVMGGAHLRASALVGKLFGLGGVRETITGLLFGFLAELSTYGRALWNLPAQMPGGDRPFAQACARLYDPSVDDPARIATGAATMTYENGLIWRLAQEWSDPQWNELWCDLARTAPANAVVAGDLMDSIDQSASWDQYVLHDTDALEPADTQMAVFLRRRPFPTAEDPGGLSAGAWSQLPTAIISPSEIDTAPRHRSGAERFNVFEVLPATLQEIAAKSVDLLAPLMDQEDMRYRGPRPMTMRSRYHADLSQGGSDDTLAATQRRILRDWHCLNPYLYSGTIDLATLRPGIRIGTRACVTENPTHLSGSDAERDLTYYVEEVGHRWVAPGRGTTKLSVTRGYQGDDETFYQDLERARGRYTEGVIARALEGSG